MRITNKKFIQSKSKINEVTPKGNGVFSVISGTSGESYTVAMKEYGATCTCKWGQFRTWNAPESGCSHVVSAYRFSLDEKGRSVSVWTNLDDAKRQKKSRLDIGDGVIITTRGI